MESHQLGFAHWFEGANFKVGKVTTRARPDQIAILDQAIRKLAATDPLAAVSRILQAYAAGCPLPPMD